MYTRGGNDIKKRKTTAKALFYFSYMYKKNVTNTVLSAIAVSCTPRASDGAGCSYRRSAVLFWFVHVEDVCDAVGRAEHQRHDTNDYQHYVSYSHHDGHIVPERGKLDEDGRDDAKQRETKRANKPYERPDGGYGYSEYDYKQRTNATHEKYRFMIFQRYLRGMVVAVFLSAQTLSWENYTHGSKLLCNKAVL